MKDFRFYLTTKLRNPHYLPEVAVKVTLLNFMITQVGLQDQLLNIVVEKARLAYVPVAHRTAILFFCIADLANIDPMYQYSLPFFVSLYLNAIDKAEKSEVLETRIEYLNDCFRYTLY